ncbi:MAG: hypothetical protein AAGM40_25205 [Cyanobacteria bacterium J06573_2]
MVKAAPKPKQTTAKVLNNQSLRVPGSSSEPTIAGFNSHHQRF